MIEIDSALDIFNKYGYSSITSHPYLYQSGDNIGICYTYDDEDQLSKDIVRGRKIYQSACLCA